jgi:hypothetical protein
MKYNKIINVQMELLHSYVISYMQCLLKEDASIQTWKGGNTYEKTRDL